MINNDVFKNHKKMRIEQLEFFDYIKFKCLHEDESIPECRQYDGQIQKKENNEFFKRWLNCDNEYCGCQLYGESKQSLKRKGLQLSK